MGEFVGFCALLMSLVAMSTDSILPALTTIGRELGVADENRAQLVISALFLGLGLGQMVYGPLSDRFGRRPAIQAGLALFLLGSVLSILSDSFLMMLAGRVLQGLGVAGPRIVTVAMVRDRYAGAAMARIMSLVMSLFVLVPVVAPTVGQVIFSLASWRWIFGVLLVVALIGWAWLLLRHPETLKPEHRRPLSLASIARGAAETFRNRRSAGYALASGLLVGAFLGFLNSVAQMFQEQYGLGALFPLYFAALALALGSASLLNSQLVMRFGMRWLTRVAITGVVISSSTFFLVALVLGGHPPLWALMLFLLSVFFCVGLLFGNLNALAMEPLGHIAGIAASTIGTVTMLIAMVLGGGIGFAYDGTVLPMVGGFTLLGMLSFAAMRFAERRRPQAPR
ncbi:MAG: multidrug effflux MFS transporter [Alphaproteobacteria bacterium]